MAKVRKIIPALDVADLDEVRSLISRIGSFDIIYGYKIGFSLGLTFGLPRVVEIIKSLSDKPVIYDHQKAATDIPDTGKLFAKVMKQSNIDEIILFPQAGPATLEGWIRALRDYQFKIIVGGIMTHPKYVQSEGGFIRDEAVEEIYRLSYDCGIRDFVVPLTKPQITKKIYQKVGLNDQCVFYSPGFGSQGGNASDFDFIKTHYLIIGRSLLQASQPESYLEKIKNELDLIH